MPDIKKFIADQFKPTTSLGGNETPSVIRGANVVFRGGIDGMPYFENFTDNLDLGEDYDVDAAAYRLTGTISFVAGVAQIQGAGGSQFISELHYGQLIEAGGEIFAIKDVLTDELANVFRAPDNTQAGLVARRLPQLSELNRKRCVMLTGNAIEMEKGHIIAAGSGDVYVNGAVLPGSSLSATNEPQAAIYRATTADYVIRALGFDNAPPKPSIAVVAGGTKAMTDGNKFSFMISYWTGKPEGTDGYSNPCEVLKQTTVPADIQISGANNRFEMDFTASLVGIPANAQGFIIWGSLGGKKSVTTGGTSTQTTNPNITNFENGPWYRVAKVKLTDLVANKYTFEYLDSEVYELVTGDNFAPPQCEFIAKVESRPMYISCYGKRRSGGKDEGANPGPACQLSKYGNPDGAPPEWSANVQDIIIGWFEGVGRWFMMTPSSLEFVVPTGLTGSTIQGGSPLELPLIARPYWKTGAANRYSIILVDDTLYGISGNKFFRSVGNGDESVEKYDFGGAVEDLTRLWNPGYGYTVEDKKNGQILFIHTAAYKNSAGYWVTEILPFSLRNAWLPKIILSSETQDMVVSGVANINERVEFLAGGRKSGGAYEVRTYRYDEQPSAAAPIDWFIVWQISDDGLENLMKQLHSIRPDGRLTDFGVQIYVYKPGDPINMEDLEAGTNATATITFPDTSEVTQYLRKRFRFKNAAKYAIRVYGTWSGVGKPNRLEELALEISAHGKKR